MYPLAPKAQTRVQATMILKTTSRKYVNLRNTKKERPKTNSIDHQSCVNSSHTHKKRKNKNQALGMYPKAPKKSTRVKTKSEKSKHPN